MEKTTKIFSAIKGALVNFAILVTRNRRLRNILKVFFKAYGNVIDRKSLSTFHKYGFEALRRFDKCMTENGYNYTLAFGTMLGAVREKDFIPFDDDIDLSMWIEDYNPEMIKKLRSYDIHLVCSFSVDNDKIGKEDTFEYRGVLIDVFYFYHDDKGRPYCCDFICFPGEQPRIVSVMLHGGLLPRKLSLPMSKEKLRIPFRSIEVNIPSNYKEILAFRYGDDYMIPKPCWRPKTKYIEEMSDRIATYTEYR